MRKVKECSVFKLKELLLDLQLSNGEKHKFVFIKRMYYRIRSLLDK